MSTPTTIDELLRNAAALTPGSRITFEVEAKRKNWCGSGTVSTEAATWNGQIRVVLDEAASTFTVYDFWPCELRLRPLEVLAKLASEKIDQHSA